MPSRQCITLLLLCAIANTTVLQAAPPRAGSAVKETTRPKEAAAPKAMREFRGVWVATVGNIDWPSSKDLTSQQQQQELIAICDRAKEINLNAIVFQVRPSCDALYDSKLEPWSEYLTGQQGKPPEPYYDPLQMWVDECHKRGLELHCWFNPYRARAAAAKTDQAPTHIQKTHPEVVKEYGKNQLWLDPGEKLVQDHSLAVMMDVVKRYDIDGVHMDDYFYPYKEKGKDGKIMDFPDEPSWQKYLASGGKLSRDDWRRSNVDTLVQKLYRSIKKEKPWVKLGISPFGIWQPGYPPEVKSKFSQYGELYADAKKWINQGWVDYFTPQLYWRISSPQPYPYLLQWWLKENTHNRYIWPGLYTSKISAEPNTFDVYEIINQITITRFLNANGNVHFSMRPFLSDKLGINELLTGKDGVYAEPALVPPMAWLGTDVPGKPRLEITAQAAEDTTATSKTPEGTSAADSDTTKAVTADAPRAATADASSSASARGRRWREAAEAKPTAKPAETTPTVKLASLSWKADGPKAWLWAVFTRKGEVWSTHIVPGTSSTFDITAEIHTPGPVEVAVMGVDRNGNEGPMARLATGLKAPAAAEKPREGTGQVQ